MAHLGLQSHGFQSFPVTQSFPIVGGLPPKSAAQLRCEANRGKWDSVNNVCILPDKKPPKARIKEPEIDFHPITGRPDTITIRGRKGKPDRTFTGLSPNEVAEIAEKETSRGRLPEGTVPFGTAQAAAQAAQRQEELQTGAQPVRRELDPFLQQGETVPVIGPLLIKVRKLLGLYKGSDSILRGLTRGGLGNEELFKLQPEELRTLALTQIERNEIRKGLTNSEKFGSFVEALSLGGMTNFAAEKPSENIRTIVRSLRIEKTRATNAEMQVIRGLWTQTYGEEVITDVENNIQMIESRIKMLLQDSAEFKFDSDGINFIESKIFESRERLFSARISMEAGKTQDPQDIEILLALQDSISREDFEI